MSSARRQPVRGNRDAGAASVAAALEDDDDSCDVVTVEYRFSILKLRHFVDQLSDEQEEVVRSIGFGGVLHLTRYSKLDRHFSSWLCSQLELATAAAAAAAPGASSSAPVTLYLKDGAGEKVPVTARDVHEVLGIPNGERRVGIGRSFTEKESDAAAVRGALGLGPGQAPTLQVVKAVIAQKSKDASSSEPMTQSERDAFVVAFLLLLASHFLAPGEPVGRPGKVNEEVFHALANPSEVRLYDWAEYVLEEFRRSAGSIQQLTSGSPKIWLSGCLLFLQIFYLDRLDLETANWKVPRDVLPRVAAYDCDSVCNAIDLDRQPEWREGGLKQFGKLKFAAKLAAKTDGFGSTSNSNSKGPQPYLHSSNSEHHDSTENTDMLSMVHDATEGTDTDNVHSYSGNTAPRVQAEFMPKELLNNQQPVTQQGVPSKKRNRSNSCDMIKEASLSTEKKPTAQVTSCQTNPDSPKVINLDRIVDKTFQSRIVGSTANSASRVQSRSNPKEIFTSGQPKTQQEVTSEKRNQSEFLNREENSNHMKQEACKLRVEAAKTPVAQMSSCQTTSDSSDDCVIVYNFHPKNADPRAQSRSNPKDVFSNLHPKTEQEVPSEKISQTESEVKEEEKLVTQGTACQTTPKDVIILDSESDTECTPSCSGPEMKKEYTFGRSPFEMGLVHPELPLKQAKACFKWLEACSYQDDQLDWWV